MRRYLLVDDNAAFAENLAEILRDQGDEAVVAENGQHAIGLLREQRFDAIVTDMRMPQMSGAELLHELRKLDPALPAVVVTAYTGETEMSAAQDAGLLAVLPKPPPLSRLLEVLAGARYGGLVAIVEDDPALSDNLAEVLRSRGFSVVVARSVAEVERLGTARPFTAIVDLRIPGGPDGEALRRLREKFPGLPLVQITGHEALAAAREVTVFLKPFRSSDVVETIERVYGSSR
jgi:CheY-like chemotaxis protein